MRESGAGNRPPSAPVFLIDEMMRVWIISVGLSILAGVLPAIQGSRLLPIKALRSL
jgi:putative ABC transport system permease protein